MSIEEIIRAWKTSGKNEGADNAPENPAGEQGLSDEELEFVEGGGSFIACSCNGEDTCIHTN
ncbi:MAG TPA: mersacidin/lichenicidin family type 2 lantibiotic [Ktedonobacteraceae bacterium]|nr:mersacidin/lichenicidin family type 2 lantibiotic [Ktedonobacteraceae bacterium]